MTRRFLADNKPGEILLNNVFIKNAVLAMVTVVLMALAVVLCVANDLSDSRVFPKNVFVGGIDVSGKTFIEAEELLEQTVDEQIHSIKIDLRCNSSEFSYSPAECGVDVDMTPLLEHALSMGKGSDGADGVRVDIGYEVNQKALTKLIKTVAQSANCEPISAKAVFDRESRSFTYESEKIGLSVDVDACVSELMARFANGDFSEYNLIVSEVMPQWTAAELRENTVRLSSFVSKTTGNENRNINISLMCDYVDGIAILPDGILSINELVGERTEKKGFRSAPAIMDGKRLENDLGGGICQLSGTLYNAALLANMNIVERWPHSWSSDYLDIGLDSTLDWNSQKDLKLQNMTEHPMYITAWLEQSDMTAANVLHVEVYGEPLPDGVTVQVESEIVETYYPAETKRIYVSSMSAGRTKVTVASRIGYKTRVIRSLYLNGVLIDSEIVGTSYYAPIQGEVLVGRPSGNGGGQATPEPTINTEPTTGPTVEPTEPPETPSPTTEPEPEEEPPQTPANPNMP